MPDQEHVRSGSVLVAGRYRLSERIGQGGMGVVWRAVDEDAGDRAVALKHVRLLDELDPAERARAVTTLRREADLASAAGGHPHVVTVHGVVEHGGEPWIVMDLVDGRDLRRLVREQGVLPDRRAAHLGAQLADALEHLHGSGLVHGDVTPSNVLVTDDDTVVLTDFGISHSVREATLSTAGRPWGALAYLAPEVAAGRIARAPADVFGLGAVLFHAVRGHGPWGDGDERMVLARAFEGTVPRPRRGIGLDRVIGPMLRRRPGDRPSPARCRSELEGYRDGVRLRRFSHLRPATVVVTALGLVVIVLAVVVAIVLVRSPHGPAGASAELPALARDVGLQRAADPCGLLDRAALGRFGVSEVVTDYGNFNRCDDFVDLPGRSVQVTDYLVTDMDEIPPGSTTEQRSGLTVVRAPAGCNRTVLLPDRLAVQLDVDVEDDPADDVADPVLCGIADTAVDTAVSALTSTSAPLPRRAAPFAPGSLGGVDACGLLTRTDDPEPAPGFGRWWCRWSGAGGQFGVRFDRDVRGTGSIEGRPLVIAGRQAAELRDGERSCVIAVQQRQYGRARGEPSNEVVIVHADADDPCRAVRAAAETVVSRLPRPT